MCEEDTKQKFLFLSVFEDAASPLERSEIRSRLKSLSDRVFKTEKYLNRPLPFERLIKAEAENDAIERVGVSHWGITASGIQDRDLSFRPYVEASLARR